MNATAGAIKADPQALVAKLARQIIDAIAKHLVKTLNAPPPGRGGAGRGGSGAGGRGAGGRGGPPAGGDD